jgi:phage anti-repressor protein
MDWMGFGWAGSTQVPTVSARHLHAFLEVGKDFSDWVKGRVDAFGFVEGQDFVVIEGLRSPVLGSAKSRAQTTKEYHLSIDMAKELSMVERNEKGKQARRYFIERERRTVEGAAAPPSATSTLPKAWALTAHATFAILSPDIRLTYWNLGFASP